MNPDSCREQFRKQILNNRLYPDIIRIQTFIYDIFNLN